MKTVKQSFLMFLFLPAIDWVIRRTSETAKLDLNTSSSRTYKILRGMRMTFPVSQRFQRKRHRKIEASPPPKKENKTKRKIQGLLMALPSVTRSSTASASPCGLT